jgi:SSS family solute:Na+ symporter
MAFFVGDIAPTVLEAINKIGSLANGSILAVFLTGMLMARMTGSGITLGLLAGIIVNAILWQFQPDISWLWWNVIGFFVTTLVGSGCSLVIGNNQKSLSLPTESTLLASNARWNWPLLSLVLVLWFFLMLAILWWIN